MALLDPIFTFQESFRGMFGANIESLLVYTLGIVFYGIFVWHFYKYIGQRDVFKWDSSKYEELGIGGKFGHSLFYFFKYLIAYPVLIFVWFGVFAAIIFVLGNMGGLTALIISFALVTGIRITAYYREEISTDLGKLLPLGMLAVFILQPAFLQFDGIVDKAFDLISFGGEILQFAVIAIAMEWLLRILWSIKRSIFHEKKKKN